MITKKLKIIALNIVFFFAIQIAFSGEFVFPKKKPNLSLEILEKKISINILFPPKKPSLNKKKDRKIHVFPAKNMFNYVHFFDILSVFCYLKI